MKKLCLLLVLVMVSAFGTGCLDKEKEDPKIMFTNQYPGSTINSVEFGGAKAEKIKYYESSDYITGKSGSSAITWDVTLSNGKIDTGTSTNAISIEDGEKYEVLLNSSGQFMLYRK
jgi:hypothetical protein